MAVAVQGSQLDAIEGNLQDQMCRARDEKSTWTKAGTVSVEFAASWFFSFRFLGAFSLSPPRWVVVAGFGAPGNQDAATHSQAGGCRGSQKRSIGSNRRGEQETPLRRGGPLAPRLLGPGRRILYDSGRVM